MPNVYPLDDKHLIGEDDSNTAGIPLVPPLNPSNGILPTIPAEKIIQNYKNRFVTQEQIDKWNSLIKSIEQNNGVNYRWYQNLIITQDIIDNSNLITLPNNKCFYDLDSRALMVFVNDNYVGPSKYIITNQRQFYFKNGVVNKDDIVHIVHLNKENHISNYDTTLMAIATTWQYLYTNNTTDALTTVTLDENHTFLNPNKYSIMVYIDGMYIPTSKYSIPNYKDLVLEDGITLEVNSTINIIQLGQVLPNEEYVGFVWGDTIIAPDTGGKVFTLGKGHAFTNLHDKSALVFINGKINKRFTIVNSNTIEFDEDVGPNTNIEIIQLGYTTDILRIKEILSINNFDLLDFDPKLYIRKIDKDVIGGYAAIGEDGFINSDLINVDGLMDRIKTNLTASGWKPNSGSGNSSLTVWKHEGELVAPNVTDIIIPVEKPVTNNKSHYLIAIFGQLLRDSDFTIDIDNNTIKIINPFYQQNGMQYIIWHISN